MHLASLEGNSLIVKALLEHGSIVRCKNNGGFEPLHCAAEQGHLSIVQLLVEHGVALNCQNPEKLTPLHFAETNGHYQVVEFLKARGGKLFGHNSNMNSDKSFLAELEQSTAELEQLNQELMRQNAGCYITTAVCEFYGKPDDCCELTKLRRFRDHWLAKQEGGKELISRYYCTAPKLVRLLDQRIDREQIYQNIYQWYLLPCLAYIEAGKLDLCRQHYIRMIYDLEQQFKNK